MAALIPAIAAGAAPLVSNALALVPRSRESRRKRRVNNTALVTVRRTARNPTRRRPPARSRIRSGPRNRTGGFALSGKPHPVYAPSSVSSVGAPSSFRVMGAAPPTTDYDSSEGIRFSGSMEFGGPVRTGSDYSEDAKNGGLSSTTALAWYPIRPGSLGVSTRIYVFGSIFAAYRFSYVRFRYVPASPSTDTAQVYFALAQDADDLEAATGAVPAMVREFGVSAVTPSWQGCEIVYRDNGKRTWLNDSQDVDDLRNQLGLVCVIRGGTTSKTYGRFEIDYVVDMYYPKPIISGQPPLRHNHVVPRPTPEDDDSDEKSTVSNVKDLYFDSGTRKDVRAPPKGTVALTKLSLQTRVDDPPGGSPRSQSSLSGRATSVSAASAPVSGRSNSRVGAT